MDLETMFVTELVLAAVLLIVMVGTLLYLVMDHRRLWRQTGRQAGIAAFVDQGFNERTD